MLLLIKKVILTVITFIFMTVIVVILAVLNIGLFILSGGKSYGDFSGDNCIEYMSYNFDTNLVSEDDEITCHIESLFPDFLSQYSFAYQAEDNYVSEVGKLGLSETQCEGSEDKTLSCYTGVYKNSSQYIEFNEERSEIILHRINH